MPEVLRECCASTFGSKHTPDCRTVVSKCNCETKGIGKPKHNPECPVHGKDRLRTWCCYTRVSGPHTSDCPLRELSPDAKYDNEINLAQSTEGFVMGYNDKLIEGLEQYDAVNPPHYQRGPVLHIEHQCEGAMVGQQDYVVQCMDVMRYMQDPRLATAFKYIWRVAFGGKSEPWDTRSQEEVSQRDINSAIWYLQDFLAHPVELQTETKVEIQTKIVREYLEPKNSGIDID